MGQLLSLPMILIGLGWCALLLRGQGQPGAEAPSGKG